MLPMVCDNISAAREEMELSTAATWSLSTPHPLTQIHTIPPLHLVLHLRLILLLILPAMRIVPSLQLPYKQCGLASSTRIQWRGERLKQVSPSTCLKYCQYYTPASSKYCNVDFVFKVLHAAAAPRSIMIVFQVSRLHPNCALKSEELSGSILKSISGLE